MLLYGSFRKLGVPYFGVLKKQDPAIWVTILGSPVFGNPYISVNYGQVLPEAETGNHRMPTRSNGL